MAKTADKIQPKKVRLACHAPNAKSVHVAGTFNDWDTLRTPMARNAKGEWIAELKLAPGRYEYKFVVDGQWRCEPDQPDEYRDSPGCVCNEHGTMNRVIEGK